MSECEVTKVNAPKLDVNPQLIVLTVEEAKEFLIAFQDLIDLHEDGYIKVTDFGFDVFDLVKKRIEQAEGKE